MTKTMCLFCGKVRTRGRHPEICKAKGIIMRSYALKLPKRDFWKVLHAIESGIIDLDGEATRLLQKQKRRPS